MSFDPTCPFNLPLIPPSIDLKNPLFFDLLLKARIELAELNGSTIALPNPMLLLSPAIVKESLASSEIEDIHTTLVEALQNQLFPESEQKHPIKKFFDIEKLYCVDLIILQIYLLLHGSSLKFIICSFLPVVHIEANKTK